MRVEAILDSALWALGALTGGLVAGSAWAAGTAAPPLLPWDALLVCAVSGFCGGLSSTLGALHAESQRADVQAPAQASRRTLVRVAYDLVTGAVIGALVVSASSFWGLTVVQMLGLAIVAGMGGSRIAERLITGAISWLDRVFRPGT